MTHPLSPRGTVATSPTISAESYQRMADEALRSFLRPALTHVRKRDSGARASILLTVRTQAPGVRLPVAMIAQHPDCIDLVLQERSSPLSINRRAITLGVVVDGRWSKAVIPFDAILRFADQSAGFVIDFPQLNPSPATEVEASKVVSLAAFRKARG
ncbi:ClpXP protease specificity-enhancing factor SspB [Brevundimonas diminuta]|uniref:ClpXP protease specificity-enhancing factor SspB n=1 Tax=Brevundimonas diminuta TaxID=293 RepID=UPI00069BEB5F|nr:ClpXP protease specificity-enhancing factor SspB [Brevundimonas diminuta]